MSENGETVDLSFAMKPSFEMLQEVSLKGARFGQSKALNDQKESSNIKNVISEEQIQSFPDLNTAEVMQRVPGVTIQRDNGEGRASIFRKRGNLVLEDLLLLTRWKSPRSLSKADRNSDQFVPDVTRTSLCSDTSEEFRIKVLTVLHGVQWSVASAILHFAFPDQYPILDFRAIWSLRESQPSTYTYDFW